MRNAILKCYSVYYGTNSYTCWEYSSELIEPVLHVLQALLLLLVFAVADKSVLGLVMMLRHIDPVALELFALALPSSRSGSYSAVAKEVGGIDVWSTSSGVCRGNAS